LSLAGVVPKDVALLGYGASHPELKVRQMTHQPPFFFVACFRGLITVEQQALFAKAEKMFDVVASLIGVENVQQYEFAASFSHDYYPERSLES